MYVRIPVLHVSVKTCVFNCNKGHTQGGYSLQNVARLMWSWTESHSETILAGHGHEPNPKPNPTLITTLKR